MGQNKIIYGFAPAAFHRKKIIIKEMDVGGDDGK